ncbi:AP-3 complex subunit delta [Rhizina undulata]
MHIDIKAAAILKLIYLEMFGHDMSWASFHVLEVMSSPKFMQKRVGYLAAVQSFRLDTDVLMLATNLLKKDLSSPSAPETSLAINGLSHIVSPSLARDLAPDLLSKLSHTSPHVRKKAVLVLYKCFLQSPELLRTSWPRLRDCLNDEDGSVVSATVNVVCELARRNPKNYLPLAPQLFKLLTEGGNNWMTIKLIKLFATLTPLEPRLIKKLIPPITNLIQTTPAMSLLYECINGLISGGLLAGIQETDEGEELASVCVTKLRGFLVEGDSNLKYVGLLALTKLVGTHAHLVAMHQDVILDCIDDADISIRYRALELVVGMVDSDSLPDVVGRLMRQLKPAANMTEEEFVELEGVAGDGSEEDMEEEVMHSRRKQKRETVALELPEDYKRAVIERIIEMCARDMYANVGDFEWYLDVLVQLVRYAPPIRTSAVAEGREEEDVEEYEDDEEEGKERDVGEAIGRELRNIAIRVKSVTAEAVRCAEMLVARRDGMFPAAGGGGKRVLCAAGFIVGEYSSLLTDPSEAITSLLHPSSLTLPPDILAIYIQAIPKVYACLTGSEMVSWTPSRKSTLILLTDRIVKFLEPLSTSPNLEVQERAVEFLELFRLAAEAIAGQPAAMEDAEEAYDPPLLLTQAIPAMFVGVELNPVAPRAQRKVPVPVGLDLDEPVNPQLHALLAAAEHDPAMVSDEEDDDGFGEFYYKRPVVKGLQPNVPASVGIDRAAGGSASVGTAPGSYQLGPEEYLDKDIVERRRKERRERNKDDPFYIFAPGDSTPNTQARDELDLENIPIMKLELEDVPHHPQQRRENKERKRVEIVADEGIDGDDVEDVEDIETIKKGKRKKGLLSVDASGLMGYSLEEEEEVRTGEEVKAAREEVERFKREMERAAEMVKARETVSAPKKVKKEAGEGKNKKKKKKKEEAGDGKKKDEAGGGKKKKAKKVKGKDKVLETDA